MLNRDGSLTNPYIRPLIQIGLCLSRAAAMVINFNLLLVWLPMCKYSLTRLACLANHSLRRQRESLARLERDLQTQPNAHLLIISGQNCDADTNRTLRKLKSSITRAYWQLCRWCLQIKAESTNSFLIAVDHCKSLHTICATTITIASGKLVVSSTIASSGQIGLLTPELIRHSRTYCCPSFECDKLLQKL